MPKASRSDDRRMAISPSPSNLPCSTCHARPASPPALAGLDALASRHVWYLFASSPSGTPANTRAPQARGRPSFPSHSHETPPLGERVFWIARAPAPGGNLPGASVHIAPQVWYGIFSHVSSKPPSSLCKSLDLLPLPRTRSPHGFVGSQGGAPAIVPEPLFHPSRPPPLARLLLSSFRASA